MKTYEDLVKASKQLISAGMKEQFVYHFLEEHTDWAADSLHFAIDEAQKEISDSFSDNVLDHRPKLENLKAIGKEDDYMFQALAYMGDASYYMAWTNTILEFVESVPDELKQEIKKVHSGIWEMQYKLREVQGQ